MQTPLNISPETEKSHPLAPPPRSGQQAIKSLIVHFPGGEVHPGGTVGAYRATVSPVLNSNCKLRCESYCYLFLLTGTTQEQAELAWVGPLAHCVNGPTPVLMAVVYVLQKAVAWAGRAIRARKQLLWVQSRLLTVRLPGVKVTLSSSPFGPRCSSTVARAPPPRRVRQRAWMSAEDLITSRLMLEASDGMKRLERVYIERRRKPCVCVCAELCEPSPTRYKRRSLLFISTGTESWPTETDMAGARGWADGGRVLQIVASDYC